MDSLQRDVYALTGNYQKLQFEFNTGEEPEKKEPKKKIVKMSDVFKIVAKANPKKPKKK